MMRNVTLMILLGVLFLAACGGESSTSANNENATLDQVTTELAGLKNNIGAEAEDEGEEVFRTK